MTNAELRAALEDFGDHLPVVVLLSGDDRDREFPNFEVDYGNRNGEPFVELRVEV